MDGSISRLAIRIAVGLAIMAVARLYLNNQYDLVASEIRNGHGVSAAQVAARSGPYDYTYNGKGLSGLVNAEEGDDTHNHPRELDGRLMSPDARAQAAGWGAGQTLPDDAPVIDEHDR